MGIESRLRRLQDRLRDSGWRIRHIHWLEDGRLEIIGNSPPALALVLPGMAGFFGGIYLLSHQTVPVPQGIAISVTGLFMLMASRFVAGYFLYRRYVPVTALCLDMDIREFADPDPDSMYRFGPKTVWSFRLLCEHTMHGQRWEVTPMIAKRAFPSERKAREYIADRMDEQGCCTLWINPDNPLQTIFHRKPLVAIHS